MQLCRGTYGFSSREAVSKREVLEATDSVFVFQIWPKSITFFVTLDLSKCSAKKKNGFLPNVGSDLSGKYNEVELQSLVPMVEEATVCEVSKITNLVMH